MFCYISLQIKFDSLEYFDYRYSVKLQLNKTSEWGEIIQRCAGRFWNTKLNFIMV